MIKEPLLLFALVGVAIIVIYSWWESSGPQTIAVTDQLVQELVQEREDLLGHEIEVEERDKLVENYIDQQVLILEARKLGLDKADKRISNLLADRMRTLLAQEPPGPTEVQLDSFYRQQLKRYRSPDLISFQHVFYSAENPDTAKLELLLPELETATVVWDQLGDRFWLGSSLEGYDKDALTTMLGVPFTHEIFDLDLNRWYGPFESTRGNHLVRVVEKSLGTLLPIEQARSLVIQDWKRTQREILIKRKIEKLREEYKIERVSSSPEKPDY